MKEYVPALLFTMYDGYYTYPLFNNTLTEVGDDDYDKEWCYANSEEEAAQNIQDDHWDIESIDMVSEA